MRNDFRVELFGERLKKRRKEVKYKNKPFTQENLASLVDVDIKTIQNWEAGKNQSPDSMNVRNVIPLCKYLDCDFEYLFGAIDVPHKPVADVQAVTGLSRTAIEALEYMKKTHILEAVSSLSKIIEHEDFYDFISTMHLHVVDFNHNKFNVDQEHVKYIATALNCNQDEVKKYLEASSKSAIEAFLMKIVADIRLDEYGGSNPQKRKKGAVSIKPTARPLF